MKRNETPRETNDVAGSLAASSNNATGRVAGHRAEGTAIAALPSVEQVPPEPRMPRESFFRIATSLVFIVAGLGHIVRTDAMIARMLEAPLGQHLAEMVPARPLMLLSGGVLMVAGVALAAGYRTRHAALTLMALLVPLTVTAHLGHGDDPGPLLKNVALLGSLVHLAGQRRPRA